MLYFTCVLEFSRIFTRVFDANKNVIEKASENSRKTQEIYSMLHNALGNNSSLFFARVFAHKPYQNTTPTHNVIWVLISTFKPARKLTLAKW